MVDNFSRRSSKIYTWQFWGAIILERRVWILSPKTSGSRDRSNFLWAHNNVILSLDTNYLSSFASRKSFNESSSRCLRGHTESVFRKVPTLSRPYAFAAHKYFDLVLSIISSCLRMYQNIVSNADQNRIEVLRKTGSSPNFQNCIPSLQSGKACGWPIIEFKKLPKREQWVKKRSFF